MIPFQQSAEVYDLLYRDKDYAGEAAFVLDRLRARGAVRELLDLGCGTGRHGEQFARAGLSVLGVDRSAAMVERALARGVEAIVGDACTVVLERSFDAVTALFHVASYQTSDQDFDLLVGTAARHLRSGGLFLFDTWYAPAVSAHPPEPRVTRVEHQGVRVTRTATPVASALARVVDVHLRFEIEDDDGRPHAYDEVHPMRSRSREDITRALGRKGLQLVEMCGWRTDAPPTTETWLAHVVARKS